jgi:hypothetical protein
MEWKKIEPNVWKPTQPGDSIEGVLVIKEPKGGFDSYAYSLETTEGQVLVWGSAVLDDRMKFINPGDLVRIEFKGMSKNKKGQDIKLYEVSRATK